MITRNAPLTGELKARRHALGWTLKEVGERCAIDEGFLRDWEGGSGSPRLEACDAWAAALGLKLALVPADRAARNGLAIDWERRSVTVDGMPVRLTPMEWKALERLAAVPGELVSHEALFRHLYGDARPYERRSTAIRVLITKLRRLLPLRIEAQWGRGYIVSGIAASGSALEAGDRGGRAASAAPARPPEGSATLPFSSPPARPAMLRPVAERSDPATRRAETPAVRRTAPRNEELRVIERFLAERGATRCPDVATIEQAPLPTLVWDKVKRKWVRPGIDPHQHAVGS
jgi:transcriptional regulator with XRE-family HTH domain